MVQYRPCENGNGPSGSRKGSEFLDYLSNDQSSSHTVRNFVILPSFVHTFHTSVLLTQRILMTLYLLIINGYARAQTSQPKEHLCLQRKRFNLTQYKRRFLPHSSYYKDRPPVTPSNPPHPSRLGSK
jgi:hypothetical protein